MKSLYQTARGFQYGTVLPALLMVVDLTVIYFVVDFMFDWSTSNFDSSSKALMPAIMGLGWLLSGLLFSIYQIDRLNNYRRILYYSFNAWVLQGFVLTVLVGLRGNLFMHAFSLALLHVSSFAAIVLVRCVMLWVYRSYRGLPFNQRPCVIIGCNAQSQQLYHYFRDNHTLRQRFRGFFSQHIPSDPEMLSLYRGSLEEVKDYCLTHDVKEIYYTLPNDRAYLKELQDFAERNFIYLGIVPDLESDERRRVDAQFYNDGRIPVISYRNTPLRSIVNSHAKRAFDIVFSAVVLFALSLTVFPVVALAIKLTSRGPVFFRQLRPGLGNQPFWCYKFRTMRVNNDGEKQATKNDNRITKVGAFLRKTSLDELPQFYNVLIGDMSVVGPRPNMQRQLEYYSQHIPDYVVRHTIPPGITGYAQVNGFRGETHEMHLMEKRVEYDLVYMQNWSFMLDLKIIWLTIRNVIKGEDMAY